MTEFPQDIPVELCKRSPTARLLVPVKVAELVRSIRDVGLRQPISVRPLTGGQYEIRGGLHRHAAFIDLGKPTIPAFVRDDDDLRAELAEIDENLIRNELSPAERSIAVARRKEIYEALHPETAHGGDRNSSRKFCDLKEGEAVPRFTKATADASGTSERKVQLDAARGEKIGTEALKKVAGTSLDKGEELDALAKLPEPKRAAIIDRAKAGDRVSAKVELKKDKREIRERELGKKQKALPTKKYGVILADPEWEFEPYSRETGMDRAAGNHYPTSPTEKIAKRDVPSIAADDCVLFLWATVPMLPHALQVMEAWGFAYSSHFIWAKPKLGTGYWNRNRHELLLIGVKGKPPAPAMGTQFGSVIECPNGAHSEKPAQFFLVMEQYFPTLPKIELNRRGPARPGWDAWGNEAEPEPQTEDGESYDPTTGELKGDDPSWPDDRDIGKLNGDAAPVAEGGRDQEAGRGNELGGDASGEEDRPEDHEGGEEVGREDTVAAPPALKTQAQLDEAKSAIPAFMRRENGMQA